MSKKNNYLIIKASGVGFIFAVLILTIMLMSIITTISLSFIWFNKSFSLTESIFAIIILVIGTPLFVYEYIMLFKEAKVLFDDTNIFSCGHRNKTFPKINKKCEDIIGYRQTTKSLSPCIEFTLSNGKILNFSTIQHTKKQIIQILNEIKKRGGLQNQDIIIK